MSLYPSSLPLKVRKIPRADPTTTPVIPLKLSVQPAIGSLAVDITEKAKQAGY